MAEVSRSWNSEEKLGPDQHRAIDKGDVSSNDGNDQKQKDRCDKQDSSLKKVKESNKIMSCWSRRLRVLVRTAPTGKG
jgi:hypothetical protein